METCIVKKTKLIMKQHPECYNSLPIDDGFPSREHCLGQDPKRLWRLLNTLGYSFLSQSFPTQVWGPVAG